MSLSFTLEGTGKFLAPAVQIKAYLFCGQG
jgi:hypothetical protein